MAGVTWLTHCAADFFGLGPAVPGGLGVRATRTRSFAHSHIPGRPSARPSVRISDERSVSIHEWGGVGDRSAAGYVRRRVVAVRDREGSGRYSSAWGSLPKERVRDCSGRKGRERRK